MMKWSHSIPLTIVLVVGLAAAALVLVAMFITDQGEETLHFYKELSALGKKASAVSNSGMELQGRWLGMSLAAADSATARSIGVREGESGIVVVDFAAQGSDRPRSAGLTPGDRIVSIDGKPVRNMADLYNVSRVVSPAAPTLIEVRRGEFPMTLVMPAATQPIAPRGEAPEAAAGAPAAWAGSQYYCPREGILLPLGSVGPSMRCPRCQTPVQPYRPWP